MILIGTGSELQLAMGARDVLAGDGIHARVVSLPCWELFAAQSPEYRESVLPARVRPRVSVESGVSMGWDRWVGDEGAMISIERFGLSGPGQKVLDAFGFTVDHVVQVARGVIDGSVRGVVSTDPEAEASPPFGHGRGEASTGPRSTTGGR